MKTFVVATLVALAVTGFASGPAFAQSSCGAWKAKCEQRCKAEAAATCRRCDIQMSQCMNTGCWKEGAKYGGATRCNLKKS